LSSFSHGLGLNNGTKGNYRNLIRVDFIEDFLTHRNDGAWSPFFINENTLAHAFLFIEKESLKMAQAKTLTAAEFDQVLNHISLQSFPLRNRVMFLTGYWSGMRVGELASLKVGDVMNVDGSVKAEVRLTAEQTKGRHPRTVFLPQKLRDELQSYLDLRKPSNPSHPLFITAGRKAFTANVMTQHFHYLFKKAGIAGASSHTMRRSFITSLASKGIGVRVLASLAGHRSIAVTQKYIDVNDEMKRNAVEMI
jgi:integrase/recombinase XerD